MITMKNYKIAVLKGDGIGPEIVNEAMKALDAVAEKCGFAVEYDEALLGGCAIDATGVPLPDETVAKCKAADSTLLGAVGGAKWDTLPGHLRPEKGLLGIRSALGLFANLRPARIFEPLREASPLRADIINGSLDIMVVRELTGGIYFGERGRLEENGVQAAYDTEKYSVPEIERIARIGFDLAMKRGKKLCSVDKANVLESSRLWRETVTKMAAEYPEVELSYMYVDNCAMQLVRNPSQFDVILTSNIFGDILSDEASMIFLSVAMMLKYSLGQPEASDLIETAVAQVLTQARTPDIYVEGMKKVSCSEMGDLVAELIRNA